MPTSDTPEAPNDEFIPLARPIGDGAPMAQPVAQWEPDDMLLCGSTRGRALIDLAVVGLLFVRLGLAGEGLLLILWGVPIGGTEPVPAAVRRDLLVPTLAMRTAITIALLTGLLLFRREGMRSIGVTRRALGVNLLLGLGTMLAACGLIYPALLILGVAWPGFAEQMQENAGRILEAFPKLGFGGLTAVCATVGVYEELLFRGFLLPRLRRITGSWTLAVLVSTAIFTSLHMIDQTLAAMVAVTILSLIFSVVTIWRRSIIPAIVGHMLFDLSQLVALSYQVGDAWT